MAELADSEWESAKFTNGLQAGRLTVALAEVDDRGEPLFWSAPAGVGCETSRLDNGDPSQVGRRRDSGELAEGKQLR